MIKVTFAIDDDILDAFKDAAQKAPKLTATAFNRSTARLRSQMLAELQKEPPVWKGKRRWKSPRQKIAVIIKLRKAGNLPYKRTHKLIKGWRVLLVMSEKGGMFSLENAVPYGRFVQGDDAQPMHLDSGWRQVALVVAKYRPKVEEVLVATWFTVVDPGAK